MSTLLITLPGVLTSTAGLDRVIPTNNGFPSKNLTDLLMFTDGSGTSVTNSVTGRSVGVIEHPGDTVNNAYAWMANGGLQLDGTEIVSLPASDASTPWTLVSLGATTGSVGTPGTERISGVMSFRQFSGSAYRGVALYHRGGNDWNTGTPNPYATHRPAVSGSLGAGEALLPSSGLGLIGKKVVVVMSYNGSGTLTSTLYDKTGAVVCSDALTLDETAMLTVGGVYQSALNPCLGIASSTYSAGRQQIEAFARYSKVLDSDEINRLIQTGIELGAARGRAW